MNTILAFFLAHWALSIFAQTFFLHRYAAHAMFRLNRFWERFFHLFTILAQGPSYLNPFGYAILHRMHHAYSDTPKDPHSPMNSENVVTMMMKTKHTYDDYAYKKVEVSKLFQGQIPEWGLLDSLGQSWFFRIGFGSLYALFYYFFVPPGQWGWYLLLPLHWMMGPLHGAIVNWCGHKYGYRTYKENGDNSRNTLPVDLITFGELYQNNHHANPTSPNLAQRWFEIDIAYQIIRVLKLFKIVRKAEYIRNWNDVLKVNEAAPAVSIRAAAS